MTMLAIAPPEKFRQAVIAGLRDRLILKLGGLCQNSGYDPRQIARRSLAVTRVGFETFYGLTSAANELLASLTLRRHQLFTGAALPC